MLRLLKTPVEADALHPSIIQRVPRGATPSRTITAPEPGARVLSMIDERERLAQFERSRRVHDDVDGVA